MNRTEKKEQVTTLHERFARAKHAFLVDFKGLSVTQDTDLRNRLRDANVDYRVVKNRLAKLALKETDIEAMEKHFCGPTAIALGEEDSQSGRCRRTDRAWNSRRPNEIG